MADENMNRGLFMFWAGSLHFFGAMWDGRIMHVSWSLVMKTIPF